MEGWGVWLIMWLGKVWWLFQYWGAPLFSQEAMILISDAESGLAASKMCNCDWLALIPRADASCFDSDWMHEPKHEHLDVNFFLLHCQLDQVNASKVVTNSNLVIQVVTNQIVFFESHWWQLQIAI